jgi:hypothetical protein
MLLRALIEQSTGLRERGLLNMRSTDGLEAW